MTYHHLSVLVHRQAEKYGDKIALKYRDYETAQWIPISWKEFSQTVRRTANAMVALGIEPQENIGICAALMIYCAWAGELVAYKVIVTARLANCLLYTARCV